MATMLLVVAYAADDRFVEALRIKADQVECLSHVGVSLLALWIVELLH